MVGITKLIRKLFAPQWRYRALRVAKNPGGLKKAAAKRRGKRVDRELLLCAQGAEPKRACPETRAVLKLFAAEGYRIVGAQHKVQLGRLTTFLDLVVSDAEGRLFVVEIKRGCHYRNESNGLLRFHESTPNSLLCQHQLQCAIGRWMYEQQHSATGVGCLLIYVQDSDIDVYDEEEFEVHLGEPAKSALLAH